VSNFALENLKMFQTLLFTEAENVAVSKFPEKNFGE
jgi:hypothetical protein